MSKQDNEAVVRDSSNVTNEDAANGEVRPPGAADSSMELRPSDLSWFNMSGLTDKQIEVLALLAEGLSNKQIAHRLGVALGTIKTHVSQVLRRLNVERRGEAIIIAQRMEEIRVQHSTHAQRGEGLLGLLLPHAVHARYPQGEILFRRGEEATELFYVKRGVVAMPEVSASVHAGELLGEVGLFSRDGRRTATARCDTEVEAFVLPGAKARQLYYLNPQFAMHITTTLAQRFCMERA